MYFRLSILISTLKSLVTDTVIREMSEIYNEWDIDLRSNNRRQQLLDSMWKTDRPVVVSVKTCQKLLQRAKSTERIIGKTADIMMEATYNMMQSSDFTILPHYGYEVEQHGTYLSHVPQN